MMRRWVTVTLVIGLLVTIPLSRTILLRILGVVWSPIGGTLVQGGEAVGGPLRTLKDLPTIREERALLQQELVQLRTLLAKQDELEQELKNLQALTGVQTVTGALPSVSTQVLARGNNPLEAMLTIGAGSDAGLSIGDVVLAGGAVIGRLEQVLPTTSQVRLITARSSRLQVAVGDTRALLTADGNQVLLTEVPSSAQLTTGDTVVTSGLGGGVPRGILVGTVAERKTDPSAATQTFVVRLPQPVTDPVRVVVLTPS